MWHVVALILKSSNKPRTIVQAGKERAFSASTGACKLGDLRRNSRLSACFWPLAGRRGKSSDCSNNVRSALAFFLLLATYSVALAGAPDYDLGQDSYVGYDDLAELASWWLAGCGQDGCDGSDFNGDGSVNFNDFALFGSACTKMPRPEFLQSSVFAGEEKHCKRRSCRR